VEYRIVVEYILWLAGGELWRWEDMKKNGVSRKLHWKQNKEEKEKNV